MVAPCQSGTSSSGSAGQPQQQQGQEPPQQPPQQPALTVRAVPRYGTLDVKHYAVLDTFPGDALPADGEVPSGRTRNSYTVYRFETKVRVDLKAKAFVLVHPGRDAVEQKITYKVHGGAPAAWLKVRGLARYWKQHFDATQPDGVMRMQARQFFKMIDM